jgi:hypothetical protein
LLRTGFAKGASPTLGDDGLQQTSLLRFAAGVRLVCIPGMRDSKEGRSGGSKASQARFEDLTSFALEGRIRLA